MTVLTTSLDTASTDFALAVNAMNERLSELDEVFAELAAAGGESAVARHKKRGKLTARERIELLLDRDTAFLELCPFAGWGGKFNVGGSIVGGIGVISGVECMIVANDPTIQGGTINPASLKKQLRLMDIAEKNRLPLVTLAESGGANLPTQSQIFIPGGETFRRLAELSKAGIPTVTVVFGNSTAGGAYLPGMSDHVIMIERQSQVFLGGPPLVKAATGEVSDEESLGGADMHARVSGLADHFARDEQDALRICRRVVARLNHEKLGAAPCESIEPRYPNNELLGVVPHDLKYAFDPREVIARVVDDSDFDEFKPLYGRSIATGWARIHGYPVGIIANSNGIIFSEEAQKVTQFIQIANRQQTPLIFLHNTTGYMVGRRYEEGGIIKHGSMMVNAVSTSTVPHISLLIGASYGAGHYGMCGRAFNPRFLFAWPSAKSAVMGGAQLADVVTSVAQASAEARGLPFDEDANQLRRAAIEQQIEAESLPLFLSGMVYDDGIIDPRDSRTVLGLALSAIASQTVDSDRAYGIFRM